jgi:hypothetical protein
LGKTKRFLRRIATGNTGISVRKIKNQYHVIMGGYIEQKMNGGMMMPFGGIPIGSIGAATIFFNPTQIAFTSFSNNKATRIESLLDENFNHVKGEIKENAFDKMTNWKSKKSTFSKTNKTTGTSTFTSKGSTVFKYNNFYIKTKYNTFSKSFIFKKFID